MNIDGRGDETDGISSALPDVSEREPVDPAVVKGESGSASVSACAPDTAVQFGGDQKICGTTAECTAATAATNDGPVVSNRLDGVIAEFSELKRIFEEKIRYDASREAIIDRLHAELQEYKADLLLKMMKPLALGMIRMYDDLGLMVEKHPVDEGTPVSTRKLLKLLVNLRDDIEDLLNVNGVQSFSVDGSSEFDPKQQRVASRVMTSDPALDRHVARRLGKGFLYNDRVLRPEIVDVFVRQ